VYAIVGALVAPARLVIRTLMSSEGALQKSIVITFSLLVERSSVVLNTSA
jgi:hypothetical protein